MIAPEPYFSAYLKIIELAVSRSRFLSYEASNSFAKRLINRNNEEIGDLQDMITVMVELLDEWERCDESGLRCRIKSFDDKWSHLYRNKTFMILFDEELEKNHMK